METNDSRLQKFFAAYEDRTNRALKEPPEIDVEAVAVAFTDCFIEASPKGVMCGKNDEEFRASIPKGFDFYRSIGTQSMKIGSLTTTPLDDVHVLARVHWVARYVKKDGSEEMIEFDVIYLVQILNDQPRIFAYITGDEEKLYKERGLLPEADA
jgi:hypothetical protein